jgi:hypothetical protein
MVDRAFASLTMYITPDTSAPIKYSYAGRNSFKPTRYHDGYMDMNAHPPAAEGDYSLMMLQRHMT